MNEAKKTNNLPGLIVLFLVFTLAGVALSYFYIIFQINAHVIWLNIVANFVVGLVLAVVVWIIKRVMRITNNEMSLVVVISGLVVIVFLMWNMWFVLMYEVLYRHREVNAIADMGYMIDGTRDMLANGNFIRTLRYYNERGTWGFVGGIQVNGLWLSAVWAGELLVMTVFSIMAAYASVGLYLAEKRAWVKVKLMNYGFSAFDDRELDRLASGDIDVILQKPLETRGEAMNAVAVCYHRGEPTDFIALYKAGWDRDGALTKGRHIMTVRLGLEKIDALDAGLQVAHYPTVADKIAKENELENVIGITNATVIENAENAASNETTAAEIFEAIDAANLETNLKTNNETVAANPVETEPAKAEPVATGPADAEPVVPNMPPTGE